LQGHFDESGCTESVTDKIFASYSKDGKVGLITNITHTETDKERKQRVRKERRAPTDFISSWWEQGASGLGERSKAKADDLEKKYGVDLDDTGLIVPKEQLNEAYGKIEKIVQELKLSKRDKPEGAGYNPAETGPPEAKLPAEELYVKHCMEELFTDRPPHEATENVEFITQVWNNMPERQRDFFTKLEQKDAER
jgi:hypothetical protein